ncbi:hypothetical protein ACS0TY_026358 [Phlomoides rotata]
MYTHLKLQPVEVLQIAIDHPEMRLSYSRFESDKFCHFHNEYGHDTDNYFHLRDEIERIIQAGHMNEFIYQDRQSPNGKKRKEPEKKHDDKGKTPQAAPKGSTS